MEETFGDDSYLTLAQKSNGLYKDRGSKFLYFSFPVRNEEEIKEELSALRKTYYNASHHCYAWILGKDGEHFRANDDGEPNHSAGDPILGQIKSNQLTNTLIVVVRYFGGTKLGVSGLIQAYRQSAALAIEENEIIREFVQEQLKLTFPYPSMNEVMKVVKSLDLEIINQKMELDCELTLRFRAGLKDQVLAQLEFVENLTLSTD
ncbi:putative YigZ family protein [Algoriphagus boseongensis]|uniref:Putative YigZ family protein n=1 Tax=Algoriphagus boseongensis TaxID=1442587 RepID=A0A4R6T6C5_9BACT|nr:YigZ family protein [Algoriphagus boseongensis]TDQ16478.1 putative YigZ family protein [Algoriphagus boseongensis]